MICSYKYKHINQLKTIKLSPLHHTDTQSFGWVFFMVKIKCFELGVIICSKAGSDALHDSNILLTLPFYPRNLP